MEIVQKLKLWFLSAGFRSVGYLGGAVAALVFGQAFIAGALTGVFLSDNWVTIKELINK